MSEVVVVEAVSDATLIEINEDIVLIEVLEANNEPEVIEVLVPGPQGPAGFGGTPFTYQHTQASPASSWPIQHNLGKKYVTIAVAVADELVITDVTFIDANNLEVVHASPYSGVATIVGSPS